MTTYIYEVTGAPVGFIRKQFVYELSGWPVAQLNGSCVHRLNGEYIGELFLGSIVARQFDKPGDIEPTESPGPAQHERPPRHREVRGHGYRDVFYQLLRQ